MDIKELNEIRKAFADEWLGEGVNGVKVLDGKFLLVYVSDFETHLRLPQFYRGVKLIFEERGPAHWAIGKIDG